jgi:hypothetical protein
VRKASFTLAACRHLLSTGIRKLCTLAAAAFALAAHAAPIDMSSTNPFPASTQGGPSYEATAIGGHPVAEGGAV